MDRYSNIKELIFEPSNIPSFLPVKEYLDLEDEYIHSFLLCHCIYIERGSEADIISAWLQKRVGRCIVPYDVRLRSTDAQVTSEDDRICIDECEDLGFVRYIQQYPHETFDDVHLVLDMFPDPIRTIEDNRPIMHSEAVYEAARAILRSTRGIILWHHQLEGILSLILGQIGKVKRLRKDLNAGKLEEWSKIHKIPFSCHETLGEFLERRLLKGSSINPNTKGAKVLYDYLRRYDSSNSIN